MTTGKLRERRARAAETTLSFTGSGGARLDLMVRVSADGAAYRYVLPGPGGVTIRREASSFTLPTGAPAWLLPYSPNYENVRVQTTAGGSCRRRLRLPVAVRRRTAPMCCSPRPTWTAATPAPGSRTPPAPAVTRSRSPTPQVSSRTGPLATPWRTAVVGDLATVTGLDAGRRPRAAVEARRHLVGEAGHGGLVLAVRTRQPARPDPAEAVRRLRRPQRLAVRAHRRGLERRLGARASSATPAPVASTCCSGSTGPPWTPPPSATRCCRWSSRWGVAGVKVDFMDSDSQARFRWYDDILAATAEHQLMVNFHGATIPRGAAAHLAARDDARGGPRRRAVPYPRSDEHDVPVHPQRRRQHGLHAGRLRRVRPGHDRARTRSPAAVVFESGWQHPADKPESYEARPEALRTLNQLPAVWDETTPARRPTRPGGRTCARAPATAGTSAASPRSPRRRSRRRWASLAAAGGWLRRCATAPDGLVREARIVERTDRSPCRWLTKAAS